MSTTKWNKVRSIDYQNREIASFETKIEPTGAISSGIVAENYDTSGNLVAQNWIDAFVLKNGTTGYSIQNPGSFRTAIGVNKALFADSKATMLESIYTFSSTNKLSMNNIKTTGEYCTANAGSLNVTDHPYPGTGFNLIVKSMMNNDTYLKQILSYYSSGKVYIRNSSNGGSTWSSWLEIGLSSSYTGDTNWQAFTLPGGYKIFTARVDVKTTTSLNIDNIKKYYGSVTLTYSSANFTKKPYVACMVEENPAYWAAGVVNIGNTSCNVYLLGNVNNTSKPVHIIMIGQANDR